ncbi:hypothetical protein CKAN_01359100 [Cinnamomum micranthum f. kanehirae]|uniref:Uncharacterized protein n=1 Tax=Cinnamomum micranthum f. kanehirae TaxID=337451 RepID=A0A443P1U8_9MAGN|nr:hypothetical protein CKAN_01359100 [Cinnamomum micranthum f. kanehirae]
MGQSMKKLAGKDDEKKRKDMIDEVIKKLHKRIEDKMNLKPDKTISRGEFYHEISMAVQEMNESESGFQLKCPTEDDLKQAFDKHHLNDRYPVPKEEFEKIMKDLASKMGAKGMGDILLYIYGFPISATLIKQAVFPEIVSDDVFIPLITAASVFIFAKTKKL